MFRLPPLIVLILTAMAVFSACNSLGGKPSTSAPKGIDDVNDLNVACYERQQEINEWLGRKQESIAEDWIDGKITILRAGLESERAEEEANELKDELRENCDERALEIWESD